MATASFPKRKPTAEELSAESLAQDLDKLVLYSSDSCSISLDEWLDLNKPSEITREERIGWIAVRSNYECHDDEPDVIGFQKEWEKLKESKDSVTYDSIKELALGYNVTSGKWLFHVATGYKVDILWRIIATNIVNGILGNFCNFAKVSPVKKEVENYRHVVCIYNRNYTNEDDVFTAEEELRKAGIKCQLQYKPDVYSYCGIYRNNEWGLRPTIYVSRYDVKSCKSDIKTVYSDKFEVPSLNEC